MRLLLLGCFIVIVQLVQAQKYQNLSLLEGRLNEVKVVDQREAFIEVNQFLDNCIFDEKCGVFLHHSFKHHGVIKGIFLSVDRRLRCTSLTKSQALPVRFNSQGYIIDHAEDYSFHIE